MSDDDNDDDIPQAKRFKTTGDSEERQGNNQRSLGLLDVPDAVVQVQIMQLLGPKFLLPSLGAVSKKFHSLAGSDAVWKEFCSWHGAKKSKVYAEIKKAGENDPHSVRREKMDLIRDWYESIDEASQGTNILSRYRELIRADALPRLALTRGIEPFCFQVDGPHEYQSIPHICVDSTCRLVMCNRCYPGDLYIECCWCKIRLCSGYSQHPDLQILDGCSLCCRVYRGHVCLDCLPILGWTGLRKCVQCNNKLCPLCIRTTRTDSEGSTHPVTATTLEDDSVIPDEKVYCYSCVGRAVRRMYSEERTEQRAC